MKIAVKVPFTSGCIKGKSFPSKTEAEENKAWALSCRSTQDDTSVIPQWLSGWDSDICHSHGLF